MGMSTVILAIGDRWKTDPALLFLQEEAKKLEVQIVHVSSPDNSKATSNPFRLESKTVAQFGRLFGVHLAAHDPDDVLVTADVDMMVINAASYLKGHWSGADLRYMNSNNWGGFPVVLPNGQTKHIPHYPMSYVSAPVWVWRRLIPTNLTTPPQTPEDAIRFVMHTVSQHLKNEGALRNALHRMGFGGDNWFMDEYLLSHLTDRLLTEDEELAKSHPDSYKRLKVEYSGMVCKLYRVCWNNDEFPIATDGHLMKLGFQDDIWKTLNEFWPLALAPDDVAYLRDYRLRFLKVLNSRH